MNLYSTADCGEFLEDDGISAADTCYHFPSTVASFYPLFDDTQLWIGAFVGDSCPSTGSSQDGFITLKSGTYYNINTSGESSDGLGMTGYKAIDA